MDSYFLFLTLIYGINEFVVQRNSKNEMLVTKLGTKIILRNLLSLWGTMICLIGVNQVILKRTFGFFPFLVMLVGFTVSHLLFFLIRYKLKIQIVTLKQFLVYHLLAFSAVYIIVCLCLHQNIFSAFDHWQLGIGPVTPHVKAYLILLVFLISTFFAADFIKVFLRNQQNFSNEKNVHQNEPNSFGEMIGLLERSLTIVLVSVDAFAGVATVIAVKSIARFKQLEENRSFAEYYLVGNLWSLSFSIIGGLIIRFFLNSGA